MALSLYVMFSRDTPNNMKLFEPANPILFILAVFVKITQQSIIDSNTTGLECLSNGLCLPNNYDKENSPTKPIHVQVIMDIVQISEVDDALGTVELVLNVVFHWNDNRLIIKNSTKVKAEETETGYSLAPEWFGLEVSQAWLKRLWVPPTQIWSKMDFMDFTMVSMPNSPTLNVGESMTLLIGLVN